MLNHSCEPNCVWVSDGRNMVVRTVRDVAAGEQVSDSLAILILSLLAVLIVWSSSLSHTSILFALTNTTKPSCLIIMGLCQAASTVTYQRKT